MLVRLVNHIADSIIRRLPPLVQFAPVAVIQLNTTSQQRGFSLRDIFDGFLLATPKRRRPIREIWFRRYGNEQFKDSTKLWKPKKNIITCSECGSFHELHTICRICYNKVEEESKKIINSINNVWGRQVIDKEVQVVYEGESVPDSEHKRVVEMERPRPLWFVPNLSQKTARPIRQITSEPLEADPRVVRFKKDSNEESSQ